MGDPRKQRKTYHGPAILWQKERIEEEKTILKNYGLKNKKEIWKVSSLMKRYTGDAKKLIAATSKQAELEKVELLKKLGRYGMLAENSRIEDVLNLKIETFLDRRLQTLLVKKGFARNVKQARQFISHQHVRVGDKPMTSPGYLISIEEEGKLAFDPGSPYFSPDHPERAIESKPEPVTKKEETNERSKDPEKTGN